MCLRHLTPAVSRANSRSEGRAKAVGVGSSAMLGPAAAARAQCPPPPVRFAAEPVEVEWCRGRAVLAFVSWSVYLGLCILVCMSWSVCLGLCVFGLLPWLCCLGIPVRVRDLWGPNATLQAPLEAGATKERRL